MDVHYLVIVVPVAVVLVVADLNKIIGLSCPFYSHLNGSVSVHVTE